MRIKIPYTLNLLLPIIAWAILCSLFAYVLAITIAPLVNPEARRFFMISAPIFVSLFGFLAVLRYGGVGFWAGDDVRLINKNISKKGIVPGLPLGEVKDTFDALIFLCKSTMINVLASGLSVIVLIILTLWINGASNIDLLIILAGGLIALFFSCSFATFFCQQAMFPVTKELRRILIERGEKIDNSQLSGIGYKFYFLFFFPLFTVSIVLIATYPASANVIILSMIGLFMNFVVDRFFVIYFSNSIREIETFAQELPSGERTVFATGSFDREVVDLASNLNKASEDVYFSRKELEKSKEEMGRRVEELEKFFNVTINREIKMIELKKELDKAKSNVQKDKA